MDVRDKVVVVTGGARGIGLALCERFAEEGARAVVVADLEESAAQLAAQQFGGMAMRCDVGIEAEVQSLVRRTVAQFGRIDLFCSNAGITVKGGLELTDAEWQRLWNVNLMSRLYAARAVVPRMLAQGGGYLLHTASAAGLLTEIGSAPYSVTKHADVAFAEWLAVQYGRKGIRVSCLCPMGVETDMLDAADPVHQFLQLTSVTPAQVADAVIAGLAAEQFLILPQSQVAEFLHLKATEPDRWLRAMRRLNDKLAPRARNRRQRPAA